MKNEKQPSEVFYKKVALKILAKFTEKQLFQSIFFNKVAGVSRQLFPVPEHLFTERFWVTASEELVLACSYCNFLIKFLVAVSGKVCI